MNRVVARQRWGRVRPRLRFPFLAITMLTLGLLAPGLAAAASPMYWGATIKGDVWGIPGEAPTSEAVLARFEADTGKHITFVNTGQAWVSWDAKTMDAAIAEGAIPLVTMRLENASLADVIAGREDARIEAWAREAKAFGYPFLFRPWWEVNGQWYSWGRSPEYVAAWRHFHDVVERVGAHNVTWAWVVNTIWADPASDPTPWYPGDAYVDWVGIDAYNWGYNPIQPDRWLSAEESIQPTLSVVEGIAPGKPVCICESASTEMGLGGANESKALWIHEMLDDYLPRQASIKAYLYFNWSVESEMTPNGMRFDWPIESSPAATQAFREGIASPSYLSQLPPLVKGEKVPTPGEHVPPASPAEPAPSPESPGPTAPASNRLIFGAPRAGSKSGTAKLPVWVASPGTVRVLGAGIRVRVVPNPAPARLPFSKWMPASGRLMLEVHPVGRKLRSLNARGRVRAALSIRFSPLGGKPRTWRTPITLRERGPRTR